MRTIGTALHSRWVAKRRLLIKMETFGLHSCVLFRICSLYSFSYKSSALKVVSCCQTQTALACFFFFSNRQWTWSVMSELCCRFLFIIGDVCAKPICVLRRWRTAWNTCFTICCTTCLPYRSTPDPFIVMRSWNGSAKYPEVSLYLWPMTYSLCVHQIKAGTGLGRAQNTH